MNPQSNALEKEEELIHDEHERLEQDDFRWLADFRDVLSPYWSSRFEYLPDTPSPVLVIEGTRPSTH